MLSETGEKEEKVDGQPKWKLQNLVKYQIYWEVSEGLNQIGEEDNTDKERNDATRVALSTVADDTEDFIDENEIDLHSTISEADCKICKIEELRTSYRKLNNKLKTLSEASYEEPCGRDKERQLSSMKNYVKKRINLKKYSAAKKLETDIKGNISKGR